MSSLNALTGRIVWARGKGANVSLRLVNAARDSAPVSGLTHNFYRYPARFSPTFARAAIEAFTDAGDWVIDPFMGGGTTLVEALALGRNALGSDISALATFVTEVKTAVYTDEELAALRRWATRASGDIDMTAKAPNFEVYADAGYQRHMSNTATWRLRKAIEQALGSAMRLRSSKSEALARCVVLRTAQWALDGRKVLPSVSRFRDMLLSYAREMVDGARQLRNSVRSSTKTPSIVCLHRPTAGLEADVALRKCGPPRLVLTSPPYPGVHVLYHRWQVDGRKETPAPFWIANRLDGDGAAYYTLGDRKARALRTYFDNLREALRSLATVCDRNTIIVQMVGFSEPSWQLPRYLSIADDVNLAECFLPTLEDIGDGRLWRAVPNRKWYADQRGETNGSREVVLFHRLKR